MVERRLQILIISCRPDERAASAFFSRKPSTNGPFQTERAMRRSLRCLLPRVAAEHDEFLRRLVLAGLLAASRDAPRCDRMAAALGAATVRVVDRVHRDAAVVRHAAL